MSVDMVVAKNVHPGSSRGVDPEASSVQGLLLWLYIGL